MILGLASPTYARVLPQKHPLMWLLDRCAEYGLHALEAELPLDGSDDPSEVTRKAADLAVRWVGYWHDDFVEPDGGRGGLVERAKVAFDIAERGGCDKVVVFGSGAAHNRFMKHPPVAEQIRLMSGNLAAVAEEAGGRGLRLGLLPHLDYRSSEVLQVVQSAGHPSLTVALDCANALPVCEEPLEAARTLAPHAIAVALKDLQVFPYRSDDVTIWGTPVGRGSVDYDAILPVLASELPEPHTTTACIKLRVPPGNDQHDTWMRESLEFVRSRLQDQM